MEQLIATFHIDLPLIIAQMVNFAIVLFVLYYFALKPLMKVMEKRSQDIADGLENAELSKKRLIQADVERDSITNDAQKNAKEIITQAHQLNEEERNKIISDGKQEKQRIVDQASQVIESNKKKAEQAFRAESAEMLTKSMESLLRNYVQSGKGEKLINEIIDNKI